jgi:7,8-dihydropterin-6-yl-methyl-4-(beta-D-ribofuranosyl)aminobenzene 5'-phosphate synthase
MEFNERLYLYLYFYFRRSLFVSTAFKTISTMNNENIQLKIIYNNMGEAENCEAAWGFSAFITSPEGNILFDTGGDVKVFENNLKYFRISPKDIDYIFISHNHWDHKNGLTLFTGMLSENCVVYVPDSELENLKNEFTGFKMVGIGKTAKISRFFWSTGEFMDAEKGLWEHSLMIEKGETISLITGCSHPGITAIVSGMHEAFPKKKIELVTGGFHLKGILDESSIKKISDELKSFNIKIISPSHCTGDLAMKIFQREWKEQFVPLFLGDKYTF